MARFKKVLNPHLGEVDEAWDWAGDWAIEGKRIDMSDNDVLDFVGKTNYRRLITTFIPGGRMRFANLRYASLEVSVGNKFLKLNLLRGQGQKPEKITEQWVGKESLLRAQWTMAVQEFSWWAWVILWPGEIMLFFSEYSREKEHRFFLLIHGRRPREHYLAQYP
ncbi:hypothetical protein EPN83_01370 [Patescibacteria group bacterium]|nr:MAG: hypothetical protein EPN83_01370 [Patescibacteria group bacterium]